MPNPKSVVTQFTIAAGLTMSSTNANAFHKLCKMMGARIFLDRIHQAPGNVVVHQLVVVGIPRFHF